MIWIGLATIAVLLIGFARWVNDQFTRIDRRIDREKVVAQLAVERAEKLIEERLRKLEELP